MAIAAIGMSSAVVKGQTDHAAWTVVVVVVVAVQVERQRDEQGHGQQTAPAHVAALLKDELGELAAQEHHRRTSRHTRGPAGVDVGALRETEEVVLEALLARRDDGIDADACGDQAV